MFEIKINVEINAGPTWLEVLNAVHQFGKNQIAGNNAPVAEVEPSPVRTQPEPDEAPAPPAVKKTTRRSAKPQEPPAVAVSEATAPEAPEPPAATAPVQAPATEGTPVLVEAVREIVRRAINAGKKQEASDLLREYGVTNVTGLAPEKRGEYIAKLQALLDA